MPVGWCMDFEPGSGRDLAVRVRALQRVQADPLLLPYYDKLCSLPTASVDWDWLESAGEVNVLTWCASLDDAASESSAPA